MYKAKLLMIDDDEVFLKSYRSMLSAEYEVATALQIADGIKIIERFRPDLLLLDIRLKTEKEGLQILPEIKKRFPGIPVIIVTNWDSHLIFREALELGADDFFIKSEDLEILKIAIKNLLTQKEIDNQVEWENIKSPLVFDPQSQKLLELATKLARANCSVLITGESGVGKEEFARFIHEHSQRSKGPFVAVNCAAIPDTLLESEFFGHEPGAFTGARYRRIGKFEAANSGTLFLDEIEELSPQGQAKLLRVTQDLVVERLGGNNRISIDVRIISATRSDLQKLVREKRFREDLYYRLAVFPLHVPPLRERREDILPLCYYYLKEICRTNGFKQKQFARDAILVLKNYHWPGNIRELKNVIEKAVIVSEGKLIHASDLFLMQDEKNDLLPYEHARRQVIDQFTVDYIRQALVQNEGNISRTAKAIGLSRQMLQKLIRDYGLNES